MQNISQLLSQEIQELVELKQEGQKLYLVGGVIRDFCVGRKNQDVDVLCNFDTRLIARKFADLHHGNFFVMDGQRNISRVILTAKPGKRIFDFARLRADDLNGDLQARDFTINAMAVDLDHPDEIIDPMGGRKDLEQGILRSCAADSFKTDPVRVIRAIRYSNSLDLQIEAQTLNRLKEDIPLLDRVSGERKRDELFKILDLANAESGVEVLYQLGILEYLGFPKSGQFSQIKPLFSLGLDFFKSLSVFCKSNDKESDFQWHGYKMGRETALKLNDFLRKRNSSDRNERQLILVAAILRNLEPSLVKDSAAKLLLSREESDKLLMIESKFGMMDLVSAEQLPGDRELYHFFRVTGDTGVDLAILEFADLQTEQKTSQDTGRKQLASEVCQKIISFWFEKPEVANPILFLNGNDLMVNFDLTPGPMIGELIEKLREEQAAGIIQNRKQAMEWVEKRLARIPLKNTWE